MGRVMPPGQTLVAVTAKLQTDGRLWLVDSAGNTHTLNVEAYARLSAVQLRGSHVFFAETTAAAFVKALNRDEQAT